MVLFKDINKSETKKKADAVLRAYRSLQRRAGEAYSPKVTASFSLEPRSGTHGPSRQVENMVIRRLEAQQELEYFTTAINELSDRHYSQVLIMKYCQPLRMPDYRIYNSLGYSESEYYRMLERALLEFAEGYKSGELMVYC